MLAYDVGASGWSDELTEFHEELAGEHHYIDIASRRHTLGQVERYVRDPRASLIDIGCSSGYMLKALRARFPEMHLIGADYIRGPLEKLAGSLPGIPLLQFDLTKCPLPSNSADAVVLLNVLEHIEDDAAAVKQIHRILKPGGVAVIEVPAGPNLYDTYDQQLLHHRRYSMKAVLDLLAKPGFEILERSFLGCFLYPAFYLVKKRNQKNMTAGDDVQRKKVAAQIQSSSSNPIAHGIMRLEASLRRVVPYPFGIRCLVTCTVPVR